MTTEVKRGDLEPKLIIDISDPTETADLTGVVSWRVIGRMQGASSTLFVDTAPTVVVDPVNKWKAAVSHTWATVEVATAGLLLLEVEAMWPGSRPQTFPSGDDGPTYCQVRIVSDLG
jgi:hypothetical protein